MKIFERRLKHPEYTISKPIERPVPFRAQSGDEIFCPKKGFVVTVADGCHGWCFRNELCKHAERCEPYLIFVRHRLMGTSEVKNRV